jgi:hypothetical protein
MDRETRCKKRQHYENGSAGHQPLGRWCGRSHNLHMADTQALQCCLMLIACNASYPQAWLAAHRREVLVWERARVLAREPDRALRGHALERRCPILPPVTLTVRSFWTCASRTPQPAETSWRTCGTTPCSTRRRAWCARLIGAPCRSAPLSCRGRGARSWPTPSTWTRCSFCCGNWRVTRPQHLLLLQTPGNARRFARTTTSPGRARPGDTVMHERWPVEETAARLDTR